MSKSFDEKMREKLAGYSGQPPQGAKDNIFNQVNPPEDRIFYVYESLAAVLMLLALFQIGYNPASQVEEQEKPVVESVVQESDVQKTRPKDDDLSIESQLKAVAESSNVPSLRKESREATDGLYKESIAQNISEPQNLDADGNLHIIEPFDIIESLSYDREIVAVSTGQPDYGFKSRKRIVPVKEKWAKLYYNAGMFLIYNRFRPNLSDDIYVGEYDAPFSLSASRVGAVAEFGLQRQWTDQFASRFGLSVNNYSQVYSFDVRSTKPDSVSISESDGYLEPHFNTEQVQISERVTLIGLKAQGFWYIFPNQSNVLYGSMEYQQLLGRGPTFTYQDEDYALMKPRQLLLEIGLRKSLFSFKHGNLFAMPSIRYSLNRFGDEKALSVKPFSVGITISYEMK